jgi:hypothetical protein
LHQSRRENLDAILHVPIGFGLAPSYFENALLPAPHIEHEGLAVAIALGLLTYELIVSLGGFEYGVEVVALEEELLGMANYLVMETSPGNTCRSSASTAVVPMPPSSESGPRLRDAVPA